MSQAPIIIAGAGVGGLALAQGLLKARIPFRVFERDSTINVRSQGYRVRINGPGIAALQSVLPPNLFEQLSKSCALVASSDKGPPIHLDAITGENIKFKFPGNQGQKPSPSDDGVEPLNADRSVLRSVLIKGLESSVSFGKEFESYEISSSGVLVHFKDGSHVHGSLLIGADGVKSQVRKQFLPTHKYFDTQGRWFYGKSTLSPSLKVKFNHNAIKGLCLVQDRTTSSIPMSLLLEPIRFKVNEYRKDLPADYIYWVLGSRLDNFSLPNQELLSLTPAEAAKMTQKITEKWDSTIRSLFTCQDAASTSILRIDSAPPTLPVWETNPKITLLGDAVHAMSPTAGVGAATALRSASKLAAVIIAGDCLSEYEDWMRKIAGEAITKSFFGGKMLFGMKSFEELQNVVD